MKLFVSFTAIMRLAKLVLKNYRCSQFSTLLYLATRAVDIPVSQLAHWCGSILFAHNRKKKFKQFIAQFPWWLMPRSNSLETADELRVDKIHNSAIDDTTQWGRVQFSECVLDSALGNLTHLDSNRKHWWEWGKIYPGGKTSQWRPCDATCLSFSR
jgi:hypothetical protein